MAEMTGSATTALSSSGTDCRLPLNVNDTDLHPHAEDFPRPHTGPTEMLLCLTRIELTIAAATPTAIRNQHQHGLRSPHPTSSPGTSTHGATTRRPSLHNPDQDQDNYTYIESIYLKYCDPKIPILLLTLMATRASLCKRRIINFMRRGILVSSLDDRERDALFLCAIQMLEYDDVIYTTESLRGFLWYTRLQGPLPGYIFLAKRAAPPHWG